MKIYIFIWKSECHFGEVSFSHSKIVIQRKIFQFLFFFLEFYFSLDTFFFLNRALSFFQIITLFQLKAQLFGLDPFYTKYSPTVLIPILKHKSVYFTNAPILITTYRRLGVFPGGIVVKNLPANAGDKWDLGLIPGSRRTPGGGNGNPLLYSCLENPMERGAWWVVIHGVAKSWTWLSDWAHTRSARISG